MAARSPPGPDTGYYLGDVGGEVVIAREVMEAFNRRDRDAWVALHDPEVEFRADSGWPEAGTVSGRESVWQFVVKLTNAWEQDDFEMVEAIDVQDDKLSPDIGGPYGARPAVSRTCSTTGA